MKRKLSSQTNDWDDDLEEFIRNSNTDDKISKVLIEGMEKLTYQEGTNSNEKESIVFNEPQTTERGEKEPKVTKKIEEKS